MPKAISRDLRSVLVCHKSEDPLVVVKAKATIRNYRAGKMYVVADDGSFGYWFGQEQLNNSDQPLWLETVEQQNLTTTFLQCSQCKTAYKLDYNAAMEIRSKNNRKCYVCGHHSVIAVGGFFPA